MLFLVDVAVGAFPGICQRHLGDLSVAQYAVTLKASHFFVVDMSLVDIGNIRQVHRAELVAVVATPAAYG